MKGGIYFYRGEVIIKNPETGDWTYDFSKDFKTIDEAKNAIDNICGGTPTAKIPKRWLKDERLKDYYNGLKHW